MFTATGMGGRKNRDGTLTIRVQVKDDRTDTVVETKEYTGLNLTVVQTAILADLQARKDAETDLTLNTAVVGRMLASI